MRKLFKTITVAVVIVVASISFASPIVSAAAATQVSQPQPSLVSTDSPDILVSPVQGPPVTNRLVDRAKTSWPWYITRAAGLVAAFLLVVLMLSGIGLITGYTYKFLEPLTAWATHRAIGIAFGVSVLVHIFALIFDHYVQFNLLQLFVPFSSSYKPATIAGVHVGSLYVALGIIAFYLIITIIITSLLWVDKKPHTWKALHFLAYFAMVFVFFHALMIGTDLTHGVFRVLWIVFGVVVAGAIIQRIKRAGTAH